MQTSAIYLDQSWPGELAPVPLSRGLPIVHRERPERSAPVSGILRLPLNAPLCPDGDPGVVYRSLVAAVWVLTADVTLDLLPIEAVRKKSVVDIDHARRYSRPKGSALRIIKYTGEGGLIVLIDHRFYETMEPSVLDVSRNAAAQWRVKSRGLNETWFEVSAPGSRQLRWVLNDPRVLAIAVHG